MRYLVITAAVASMQLVPFVATPAAAQQMEEAREWLQRCEAQRGNRFCEVREITLPGTGQLSVNTSNGFITVEAWDSDDVELVAMISAQARSSERARELVASVDVLTNDSRVRAEGPRTRTRESWSTSFRAYVPMRTALELRSSNGAIRVTDVIGALRLRTSNGEIRAASTEGNLEASTTNGRIRLEDIAGEIRARTTNGAIDVRFDGRRWTPAPLDLATTNGTITVSAPQGFSADLDASTTNGRIRTDFPLTVQGRLGRSVQAPIGAGGPTARLRTTNGSIRLIEI